MKASVKREGDKVWIEGVPQEKRVEGIWHMDGLPAALRAVLSFRGVEKKYLDDTVFAAITGQPFRFWFGDDFASCLAYTHEEPVGAIVADVLGFEHSWCERRGASFDPNKRTKAAVEAAWAELKEEINSEYPVILFGGNTPADEKGDPVVVTGYDERRQLVFFVPHTSWHEAPEWADNDPECRNGIEAQSYRARRRPDETNWFGNGFAPEQGMGGAGACFFAFGKRLHTPSEREVAVAVLRRAAALGRGTLRDEKRPFRYSGLEAFDLLITCLQKYSIGGAARPWSEVDDWWFAMECLCAGGFRKAAASFVRKCAQGFGNFPQKAEEHLARAAEAYAESGAEMAALPRQFEAFGTLDDYPARVQTMGRALSSAECRKKAIDILRSIRSAETNAIAEIEKALAAMDALAFLDAHKGLFQGWNDERRQAIAEKLLAMAEQFKGTDIGARALMMAAEAHAGACEHTRPVGRDGWDRTIALYQRVADEYPGTQQAHEAQWQIAGCHGCWARSDCCEFNRGKEDWPTAIKLYQQLYETDEHPGCKCDALRRIAEIQCNFTGEWQEGLATYSRMLREFPEDPPGPHRSWTNRTCGPLNGTFLIEHDLVDFSFPSLMGRADTPEEAARIREEFVRLGPDNDGIRFHTLHYLEGALRRLGNDKQADEIKKQVGLCETWAVVGPFNGTNGAAEQTVEEIPDAFNRSRHLSEAIRTQMQTSYAPEKDKPAGGADVSAEYDVTAADGRRGKGMWIGASGTMLLNTWEIPGAFYAFAEVNSPAQQAGQLRVAISGFARAWLNGRHVLDTNIVDYPVLDQNIAPVQLKAGRNHLLMKFVPWDRAYGSFVRITDEQGVALPDVTYSTPDVPAENVRKSDFLRQ